MLELHQQENQKLLKAFLNFAKILKHRFSAVKYEFSKVYLLKCLKNIIHSQNYVSLLLYFSFKCKSELPVKVYSLHSVHIFSISYYSLHMHASGCFLLFIYFP